MKGIFIDEGVTYDETSCAVDVPLTDGTDALYYGNDNLNRVDYDSLNALISEIVSVLKYAGVKYDPNILNNLAIAISVLIIENRYYPFKVFFGGVPEHKEGENFEVVLIEPQDIKKDKFKLTKTDINSIFKESEHKFKLNRPYEIPIIQESENKLDKLALVLEDSENNTNILKTISFDVLKDKSKFKISEPFEETLQKYKTTDEDVRILAKIKESNNSRLVTINIGDIITTQTNLNPNVEFDNDLPKEGETDKVLTVQKTEEGEEHFIIAPAGSENTGIGAISNTYSSTKNSSEYERNLIFPNSNRYEASYFNKGIITKNMKEMFPGKDIYDLIFDKEIKFEIPKTGSAYLQWSSYFMGKEAFVFAGGDIQNKQDGDLVYFEVDLLYSPINRKKTKSIENPPELPYEAYQKADKYPDNILVVVKFEVTKDSYKIESIEYAAVHPAVVCGWGGLKKHTIKFSSSYSKSINWAVCPISFTDVDLATYVEATAISVTDFRVAKNYMIVDHPMPRELTSNFSTMEGFFEST